MNSNKHKARVAGLLYLLTSIPGFFSLMYIPSHFIVQGDAAATAHKIAASEFLFRLGMVSELVGFTGFIFVVRALYRLFEAVHKPLASLMVTLMLVSIPISLLNVGNELAALTLVRGASFLSVFNRQQLDAAAMFFLNLHDSCNDIAGIFWGLWLFPFGILIYRSRFLPRILGALLIPAGLAYVASSVTSLLLPYYEHKVWQVAQFFTAWELVVMLWLLIMGAKDEPLPNRTPVEA